MSDQERIEKAVRGLLSLLAERNYEGVAALTNGVRLTRSQIARAIEGYGRTLVSPVDEQLALIDAIRVRGESAWSVRVPLWPSKKDAPTCRWISQRLTLAGKLFWNLTIFACFDKGKPKTRSRKRKNGKRTKTNENSVERKRCQSEFPRGRWAER